MITPKQFYGGFPLDGTVSSGDFTECDVFDLSAEVPGTRRWRIEEITVCNLTMVTGYYSVAIFPGTFSNNPQSDMAAMNTASPPRSIRAALDGNAAFEPIHHRFIAYTQAIPGRTTRTIPIVTWAKGGEKLWAGAYPGGISLVGYGGICLTISGREYGP